MFLTQYRRYCNQLSILVYMFLTHIGSAVTSCQYLSICFWLNIDATVTSCQYLSMCFWLSTEATVTSCQYLSTVYVSDPYRCYCNQLSILVYMFLTHICATVASCKYLFICFWLSIDATVTSCQHLSICFSHASLPFSWMGSGFPLLSGVYTLAEVTLRRREQQYIDDNLFFHKWW